MFTTPETVQVVCAARKLPNQEEDGLRDVTIERADSGAFEANAPESETAVTAAIATSVRKKCTAFLKCFVIMVQKLASNIRLNMTEIGHVLFIPSSRIWHRHRQLIYSY